MLSGKKQQSISAFFTSQNSQSNQQTSRNSSSNAGTKGAKPPLKTAKPGTTKKHVLETEENNEQEDSDESDIVIRSNKRRKRSGEGSEVRPEPESSAEANGVLRAGSSDDALPITEPAPVKRRGTLSERTSKYLFSSSQSVPHDHQEGETDEVEPEDDREKQRKEKLHQQFVKKLGQPGSLPGSRNNWAQRDETEGRSPGEDGGEDEDEGEEVEELPKIQAKAGKKGTATKSKGTKLTPLEKQVIEIKKKHMDTVLVVEVGYKFRFFGEDARIASKELSIFCIPGKLRFDEHPSEAHLDRFASASIPVHRLHVHVKRLIDAGYKVGVVRQLETAALKAAGDNRNTPFIRKLTNLYTKGTYIDEVDGLDASSVGSTPGAPATGYLMCITETNAKGWGTDEKVHVGILAVQPATGDIVYDDFEDGFMRSEVESRLLHLAPCELLIVGQLSKATDKIIQHLSGSSSNVFGDKARVERMEKPKTMAAQSYNHISTFYADKLKSSKDTNNNTASMLLDKVLHLSEHVTICLSAMITHLTEYGLEHVFDLTKYFQPFGARSHMLLNGTTLTSLEIYKNQTDYSSKGSLFWCLDRTKTRFGQRLLRKWVGRPLLDKGQLEERMAAVEEMKDGSSVLIEKLKALLPKVKVDLEKSLIRIYYGKCTRPELLGVLQTLQRISNEFSVIKSPADTGLSSILLNNAFASLPGILDDVVSYLEKINPEAARNDDKYTFFREDQETEEITEQNFGIASVERELDIYRAVAAEKLRKKKIDYVSVGGIEYLIEIENSHLKNVPASWTKISGTKKVSRFHSPEVTRLIRERDQHKEALAAACDAAYSTLLCEISSKYQTFRDCVQSLAILDCILSLAEVASQPGYVKPSYIDSTSITVEQGRHPMVEQLLLDAYVPNDIQLTSHSTRALLVTGPNMGGKSSYVRQIALISIMGQIGSYVPCASAQLGLLDAVFTRMGAFDNMMAGESTFMVELSETSDILKQASSRSLVILDELGRGTSTHDGVAIAQAVLDYLVNVTKCLTLFITHYQTLSGMAKGYDEKGREELKNVHMRFAQGGEDGREITFLYEVGEGTAHRSYGLNVARLANVPAEVLDVAAVKSKELEESVLARKLTSLSKTLAKIAIAEEDLGMEKDGDVDGELLEGLITGIEQL
ncbi:MAG: Mismatch repair protein msh3 [Watsoniomyces obsoletus]|nr:MAG: Mismatch repair protein msh3 [Watsoniomyces obsoletus]